MDELTTADEVNSSIFGRALSAALLCTWSEVEAELDAGVVVIDDASVGAFGTAGRVGTGPRPAAPKELRSRE